MSWHEREMYASVARNLRARFPEYDGWEIIKQPRYTGGKYRNYELDLMVERRWRGKIERVVVEVKVTDEVTTAHVDQLNRYARNVAGGNAMIIEKILVVPCGASTHLLREYPDIKPMFLRNFVWRGGSFTWYQPASR